MIARTARRTRGFVGVGFLVAFLAPALAAAPLRAADGGAADPFFTLMAWDYATRDRVLEEMRDCGVNSVAFVPPQMLDACQKYGLRAIVFDEEVSGNDWTKPFSAEEANRHLPGLIKAVNAHPAVYGYHLKDEPGAHEFAALGQAVETVKRLAPGKWPYVNLLPGDGPDYDAYVEQFLAVCKPTVLSYDRYVLAEDGSFGEGFWTNLAVTREAAARHNVPLHNVVLTAPHWSYRELTAADVRLQVWGSLVYGATGLGYYKFSSESLPILNAPDLGNFRNGPLDEFGERTQTWHWLRNVNRKVANLAPTLLKLRSDAVYHLGNVPPRNHGPTEKTLVKALGGADFVVGDFTHEDGARWVMVVNKSLTRSYPLRPEFNAPVGGLTYVSPITGKQAPYPTAYYFLAPGEGVLLKLK